MCSRFVCTKLVKTKTQCVTYCLEWLYTYLSIQVIQIICVIYWKIDFGSRYNAKLSLKCQAVSCQWHPIPKLCYVLHLVTWRRVARSKSKCSTFFLFSSFELFSRHNIYTENQRISINTRKYWISFFSKKLKEKIIWSKIAIVCPAF